MKVLRPRVISDSGFTLIELLVVVALIGIIAAIAVPTYRGYINTARCQQVVGPVHSVMVAIVGDFAENGVNAIAGTNGTTVVYGNSHTINGVAQTFPDNVQIQISRAGDLYTVLGRHTTAVCESAQYTLNENDSEGAW